MKIYNKGSDEQYVGKTVPYEIVVRNTGDVALTDILVTDNAPAEGSIVSAEGAKIAGETATWQLAELPQGSERHFSVVLGSDTPGMQKIWRLLSPRRRYPARVPMSPYGRDCLACC
jgi:uncharacterized repeat protein (TIGR01451 family)